MKRLKLISLALLKFLLLGEALWADAQSQAIFKWAADLESGAPQVFIAPWDAKEIIGFEKEIATSLAKKMGKQSLMINNGWDGLIPGLRRKLYDAVIDGVEITQARKEAVGLSIPYYITYEQLVVHKDSKIEKLSNCKGLKVGALKSSEGAKILKEINIDYRVYATEVNGFLDVVSGRLDAFLIDAPIALYYVGANKDLKMVGGPEGRLEYAVATRLEDKALLREINEGLEEMIYSGELQAILVRWNLWNDYMAEYFNNYRGLEIESSEYEKFVQYMNQKDLGLGDSLKRYLSYLPTLGKGAFMTIKISIIAMVVAILVGFLLAIFRIYGPWPLATLSHMYIEVVRGTPLLIQLYFIFYGLPNIGIKFDPFTAGVVALGLNYAAFEAENYRAGILSVHKGQMEAARALGMTHWQGLRHVVIPQAIHIMLPPVTNDFISLLKDSSLVSVITIIDLTFAYNLLATTHFNYFGIGIFVAFVYLLIGLPFVQFARWAERRLCRERRRVKV